MPTWSNASFPNNSGAISLLILATAFETPFPIQRFLSPSRSSIASFSPVEAPDGTAARPRAPLSSVTSASIVGFPRESRICRPLISRIALMLPPQAAEKGPQLRSRLDKILNGDPAASPTRRRAHTWCSLFVAPCAPEGTPPLSLAAFFEQPVQPQNTNSYHFYFVAKANTIHILSRVPTASQSRLTTHRVDLRLRIFVADATDP